MTLVLEEAWPPVEGLSPTAALAAQFISTCTQRLSLVLAEFRHPMYISEVIMIGATCPICKTGVPMGLLVIG